MNKYNMIQKRESEDNNIFAIFLTKFLVRVSPQSQRTLVRPGGDLFFRGGVV